VKSRNSSQRNETFLVMSIRLGKNFGFQSAAEILQQRRWPDWLWQTVPGWCRVSEWATSCPMQFWSFRGQP